MKKPGLPVRVVIGGKGLKEGSAEIKLRTDDKATMVPIGDTISHVQKLIADNG